MNIISFNILIYFKIKTEKYSKLYVLQEMHSKINTFLIISTKDNLKMLIN